MGDPKDNTKVWCIKFNDITFNKFKVESGDKSYSVIHEKDDLYKFKQEYQEEYLADIERMKKCGGANVYIINEKEKEPEVKRLFESDKADRVLIIKARLPRPELIRDDLKNMSIRSTSKESLEGLLEVLKLKASPEDPKSLVEQLFEEG